MIIGIDGNEANVVYRVGVSNYVYQLILYFKKKANKDLQFIIFLREKQLSDLPRENKYFRYKIIKGPFLWTQVFLPLALTKEKLDLFFSPAHYAPRWTKIPIVLTIHDLSFFRYPEDFKKSDLAKLIWWTNYSVKIAKKIIAVSNTTKKDILKIYHLPEEKIKVIYNGFEKNLSKEKKTTVEKIGKNYFLYVGTLQPRKNLLTLIRAFYKFNKKFPDFELVLAGKKGWMYEDLFKEVSNLGLQEKVFFTDYVSEKQLEFLYKHAFAFVMPSLYEGFGLPLLEAMSYGCPVISSFSSSLPEVGGEACLYFNPQSEDDLFEKMEELYKNNDLRKQLIKKGKQRVKLFSWEKCGKETLELLIETAKK